MLRVFAIVLALMVSADYIMWQGRYSNAFRQMSITILRDCGIIR
jgi:hypothetical protein